MAKYQGKIQRIFTKDFRGTTLYSFVLAGQQGFFRTGEEPIPFKEGTYVMFNADARNNVDLESLTVVQDKAPPAKKFGGTGSSGKGMSKDDFWSQKAERDIKTQRVIQYQSARNAAIATLDIAAKAEALKLPAKQADKLGALLEAVEELSIRYYYKAASFEDDEQAETVEDAYEEMETDVDLED